MAANKWVTFLIVAVGVFMSTLDASIVNISLPSIARYFGVALGGAVEWIITAYLVVIAAILLTVGRLSDLVGRKPIWAAGLVIFTIGSALCGAAPFLPLLITFRVVQGLGAALLFAVSPAIITAAFPANERGRVLGSNAVVVALGTSAGPTSGRLADRVGTRWLAAGGLVIACVGLVLIAGLDARSSVFDIVWRLVVTGAGQALFQSPNNSALMGAAPKGQQGVAAGFLATGRVVGQSTSVAVAVAVFAALGGASAGRALAQEPAHGRALSPANLAALQRAFEAGYHGAFLVCAALAALGIFTALARGAESESR